MMKCHRIVTQTTPLLIHNMKKVLLTLALVTFTFGNVTVAQNNNNNDARRAEMVARQLERLERDLKLTDEQKPKFEEIYKRYQEELQGLRQNQTRNQNRDNDSKKELTEEEATAQLAEYFAQQEAQLSSMQARIDVQKKYCAEFSQILTPQQLLKVFQPQRAQQQGGNRGGGRGGFGGGGGFGGPGGGFGGPGGGF